LSPRVSAQHKQQRRQAILDAALDVFIGKGYQVATIDDIATRAGLSVGAIYRYFRNKSEIMVSLVAERLGRTPEIFARLTQSSGDPWERLDKCIDLFARSLRVRHPVTTRLLLVALSEAVQDGEVRQGLHRRFQGLVDYLAGVIRDGIAQGAFRPDADPVALACLLLCTADGVAVSWVIDAPEIDLGAMRTCFRNMVRAYLMNRE